MMTKPCREVQGIAMAMLIQGALLIEGLPIKQHDNPLGEGDA